MGRRIRMAIGGALLAAVIMLVLSGLVVRSTREVYLVMAAFTAGLVSAYLMDCAQRWHARRIPSPPRPDQAPGSDPKWTLPVGR